MQYVEEVGDTIGYAEEEGFWMHVQWLNPGYHDKGEYSDYLGIGNRLMCSGTSVTVRSGKVKTHSRVRELKELIYGWAAFRNLIVK